LDIQPLLNNTADAAWITRQSETIVSSPEWSLLDLVTQLGPVLTSVETGVRVSGVGLLTSVLGTNDVVKKMSHQELQVLIMFYLDRLRDHHNLLPSTLHGLSLLSQHSELDTEQLEIILNKIQTEVMVQQQVVRDRSTVFLMLSRMLTEKLEIVKKVSTLFTMTLIQAADNETDPRNLLVIFNMKLSVLNLLPVEHHYEDIFDSLSVYFPVDFTPPSGVVASVTKQQLQASLRAAISHHTLQEWSLDLIMEKLESDLESAKIDSLETLAEICSKSEPVMHTDEVVKVWTKHIGGVWSLLKNELMGLRLQTSAKVTQLAAEAVTCISKLVWPDSGDQVWSQWWTLVWSDCKQGLSQPGTRLMQSSATVLVSLGSSGQKQSGHLVTQFLPFILNILERTEITESVRKEVLLMSCQILSSAAKNKVNLKDENVQLMDKFFTLCLSYIKHLDVAISVAKIAPLLNENQQTELGQSLTSEIKHGKVDLGEALAELAQRNKDLVVSQTLPELLSRVSDSDDNCETYLECIRQLWKVGLYPDTLSPLIDMVNEENGSSIIHVLSQHKLSDQDIGSIQTVVPTVIVKLLKLGENWPKEKEQALCHLMSEYGSVLTQETWTEVVGSVDTSGEINVYFASLLSSFTRDILLSLPHERFQNLMKQNTEHTWKCISSIVNKYPELVEKLDVGDNGVGWVCVGLAKRGDATAGTWVTRLLSQLDDETDYDTVEMITHALDTHWWRHAVIGILYKQRLWSQLQPALTRGTTARHVSALVLCLPYLPSPVISASIPNVLPRVVSALNNKDTSHAALTCLNTITADSPNVVSSHLTEIVHNCLGISQQDVPVRSRLLSLSVLNHVSSLEGATSVQLASKVTRDLRIALADRKRLVRLEAAKTRNKWYLVTQPS